MSGGNKKIHNHPKANSNGFSANPQNINREGRPVSIRNQLKDLLEAEGNVTMPANQVVSITMMGALL